MSSPSETFFTNTQVLVVKDLHNGKYTVDEVESDPVPDPPDLHSGNRKVLDLSTPVPGLKLHGYYDPDTKEIGLYVTLDDTPIGNKFTASIKDGLTVEINVPLLHGKIHFYRKDNKLRFGFDLTVGIPPVTKHFENDVALFPI